MKRLHRCIKRSRYLFFRLAGEVDHAKTVFCLKPPESQVVQYCREFDSSPDVFVSVMLAKAARPADPKGKTCFHCEINDFRV